MEFLGLKDEYSESQLEESLIRHLESFLLELGGDFAFIGRQKRLRIGDQWFRVDLLFFRRRLRCLIVIDLKIGKFTHADAGQMHLYLNYAREHWTHPDENPPVGLILCAEKDAAVAHYALEGLPNKVLAAEYRTSLPDEETIAAEVERTRKLLEGRFHPAENGRKVKLQIDVSVNQFFFCLNRRAIEFIQRGSSTPRSLHVRVYVSECCISLSMPQHPSDFG